VSYLDLKSLSEKNSPEIVGSSFRHQALKIMPKNLYMAKTLETNGYYIADLRNFYFRNFNTDQALVFKSHFEDIFNTIKKSSTYQPSSKAELEKKRFDIGEVLGFSKDNILVLDLDETLVHGEYTSCNLGPEVFEVSNESGKLVRVSA
jgi:hypothetical protein